MIRRKRTLKGVRFSTRGSSTGSNTLGSTATDSQSTGDETLTQSAEEVPTTPEKFDLQGKMEDSDILSHVGKLRNEFKSTLKTRYYKEMVQEGRSIEEIYENNPSGVHDDQWKWLVDRWGTPQAAAEKEGRESSRLEQFRFQHLRKDGSDNFSSDAAEQVYDEACKMVKDSMPIPKSSSTPQDNVAIENEVYTQVFGPDKNGKMLGYGRGMTKSRLFGYGSVTRGIQSVSAINTLIEEMNAKHVEQIQTIQAEQAVREKTLLEEAESRFRTEVAEREAHLIAEAEERFMKLTEIREAKFMDMLDAREKNYEALINE
ncbi:hypothetical protein ES319_A01G205900v1 [Gossypium barbadense]|uniref:Uncharacterized protein n=1 Tax=Gossypium barbadense TaxID=3634 RepID=A0A5J5X2K4_GOSBA|nr:hypothetical protein ES319_A01G205900v1 [Gossypium barbadense]